MTLSCRRHPSFWEFWISAYPKTPSFFRIFCKDPPHLWLENLAKFPVFWNGMHCKLPVKPQHLVQHLPQVIGQKYQSIAYPSKQYHTACHLQPCHPYFSYEARILKFFWYMDQWSYHVIKEPEDSHSGVVQICYVAAVWMTSTGNCDRQVHFPVHDPVPWQHLKTSAWLWLMARR